MGRPHSADRRQIRWHVGASGDRGGCASHCRVDSARWICGLGRRCDAAWANGGADDLVRTGGCGVAEDSLDAKEHPSLVILMACAFCKPEVLCNPICTDPASRVAWVLRRQKRRHQDDNVFFTTPFYPSMMFGLTCHRQCERSSAES